MTAPRVVYLKSWNELKDVPVIDSKTGEVVGPNPCREIDYEQTSVQSILPIVDL